MKIKSIEQICKANKTIFLYSGRDGRQWISNGEAYYPLTKLPQLDEDIVFTIFDIPEEKREKYIFNIDELPGTLCFLDDDTEGGERPLGKSLGHIIENGKTLAAFNSSHGAIYINTKYLKPFENSSGLMLTERTDILGHPYIAVKDGMFLEGIILPEDIIDSGFLEKISELYEMTKIAAEKKRVRGAL
ncbi:MAG: hypothetical protein IKT56_02660 [Clostridia bacterium]|nr:hypothetical protein [Clostridia bacterium]